MIFYKTLNDFLLKESTYSDFIENNNDRINTSINTLKELQSLFSSYTDDSAEQDSFINTLEDTLKPYDKDLYYFILNTILTRSNVDTVSLGNLGVELQNNYGTEPTQILNAIEDCASNLLNVEPLEDIQDENTKITENIFSDESLYHDINFMDLNKKYIDFLKYHNIDYNSNEIYKNIFNFFELELSAYKVLENNSDKSSKILKAIDIIKKHAETIGKDPDGNDAFYVDVQRNYVLFKVIHNKKFGLPDLETVREEKHEFEKWAKTILEEIQLEIGTELNIQYGVYLNELTRELSMTFTFDEGIFESNNITNIVKHNINKFPEYNKINTVFPVNILNKDNEVIDTKYFKVDSNGNLLQQESNTNENAFTKSLAALCLIGGTLTSCSKADVKPNDTVKNNTEVVTDNNMPPMETTVVGKYAFTGGCNNWNSMYLKITNDSILVLQKVTDVWASLPQYRIIDGVGFLVHTESKMNNFEKTGKTTFEFNMDVVENGIKKVVLTKFEINDATGTGMINTMGQSISGEIKRIFNF